jgi:hypothetical protein
MDGQVLCSVRELQRHTRSKLPMIAAVAPKDSMPEPSAPPWKVAAEKAAAELDVERFRHDVLAAEAAIFFRLQELPDSLDHTEERGEINVALSKLLELKIRKLGWPNSRLGS